MRHSIWSIMTPITSFLLVILFSSGFVAMPTASQPDQKEQVSSGLSVTKTSNTSVNLAWSPWAGTGTYQVTVLNLTTNQVEQQFNTANTAANVSGLTQGHTYRFSVDKAGYVITEDVIM